MHHLGAKRLEENNEKWQELSDIKSLEEADLPQPHPTTLHLTA